MKKPTGKEIWGPGDWWRRKIGKPEFDEHLGRHGHYLPDTKQSKHDENIEKIFGVQEKEPKLAVGLVVVYIIGVLLVKLIWDSWFFGLFWPILAPFWILAKFI